MSEFDGYDEYGEYAGMDELLAQFSEEREAEEEKKLKEFLESGADTSTAPGSVGAGFEDGEENYIDLTKGIENLDADDLLAMEDDPYSDDKFPNEWINSEPHKFIWDSYLGRIPFSENLPKNIYNEIFALELMRKLRVPNPNAKITGLRKVKNLDNIKNTINAEFDFSSNGPFDLNRIIEIFKKNSEEADISKFVDVKNEGEKLVFYKDSNYEIFIPNPEYSLNDLPANTSEKDKKEAQKLHILANKYKDLKNKGYVSDEGIFILDDMRPVKETEDAGDVRNRYWCAEKDMDKWAGRMKIIKKQAQSIADYNKEHPTTVKDEYPKDNEIEYVETPHPYDERYVMIDGKVARAGVNPKSPYYPEWKPDDEFTIDEVWKAEEDYANDVLALEEEIKELKRQFKERREYYSMKGVKVKIVDRVVRQLKKDKKTTPEEARSENEIFERLSKNSNLLARLNAVA